jgi:hypothetical protein
MVNLDQLAEVVALPAFRALEGVTNEGIPLCDDHSILRVRLAKSDERARYHEQTAPRSSLENLAAVFLVDVDEG